MEIWLCYIINCNKLWKQKSFVLLPWNTRGPQSCFVAATQLCSKRQMGLLEKNNNQIVCLRRCSVQRIFLVICLKIKKGFVQSLLTALRPNIFNISHLWLWMSVFLSCFRLVTKILSRSHFASKSILTRFTTHSYLNIYTHTYTIYKS